MQKDRPFQLYPDFAIRRGQPEKVADFSTSALENIRTKDLGEVGDMVTGLITELKGFDATAEQPKGIFGWFKKRATRWKS